MSEQLNLDDDSVEYEDLLNMGTEVTKQLIAEYLMSEFNCIYFRDSEIHWKTGYGFHILLRNPYAADDVAEFVLFHEPSPQICFEEIANVEFIIDSVELLRILKNPYRFLLKDDMLIQLENSIGKIATRNKNFFGAWSILVTDKVVCMYDTFGVFPSYKKEYSFITFHYGRNKKFLCGDNNKALFYMKHKYGLSF